VTTTEPRAPRDQESWARPVDRLSTTAKTTGQDTVTGKRVSGPAGETQPDTNWEDEYEFEHFFQFALQTDYLHGRLSPRLVAILDPSGIFGFTVTATARITDYLLFQPGFYAVEGSRRSGLATFRDRDQFQLRVTYQLN